MTIEMNFENSTYASMTLKDVNDNVINAVLFSSDNWNKAQTVYIVALDDDDVLNGQITITLNISSDSSAVYFYGLSPATENFSLWIEDDDEADITITILSASSVIYEEGMQVVNGVRIANAASHQITVALTQQPVTEVIVDLTAVTLDGDATYRFVHNDISVVTLSFNSTTWNTAQTLYLEVLNEFKMLPML